MLLELLGGSKSPARCQQHVTNMMASLNYIFDHLLEATHGIDLLRRLGGNELSMPAARCPPRRRVDGC